MFALAGLAACGGNGSSPAMMQSQMTVPLIAGPAGENPAQRILVALPSASPFSMLLDTGSTGLRILPSALTAVPASSYTTTPQQVAAVFGNDRVYYGHVGIANAGVVLGGSLRIEKPLNFEIIDKVCAGVPSPVPTAAPPDCRDITATYEKDLIGGVIGVRPGANGAVLNPLAELPTPYSNGFVISDYATSPKLTVGATAENQTGFQLYQVGAATASDGSPSWNGNAELPWCYTVTVPGVAPVQGCPSTGVLTDTGGENERLFLPVAPPGTLAPNTLETLPPNSTIVATLTAASAGSPSITWTLTTGTCTFFNAPDVNFLTPPQVSSSTTPSSTNAIAPYFTNDVLYDLRGGTFGFRPIAAPTPSLCS